MLSTLPGDPPVTPFSNLNLAQVYPVPPCVTSTSLTAPPTILTVALPPLPSPSIGTLLIVLVLLLLISYPEP